MRDETALCLAELFLMVDVGVRVWNDIHIERRIGSNREDSLDYIHTYIVYSIILRWKQSLPPSFLFSTSVYILPIFSFQSNLHHTQVFWLNICTQVLFLSLLISLSLSSSLLLSSSISSLFYPFLHSALNAFIHFCVDAQY